MRHTKQPPRKKGIGRPPAGNAGQKTSGYAQITMRLPHPTKTLLDAVSAMTGWPAWRVFERALAAYVTQLPPEDRRILTAVQTRRAQRQ